MFIYHCSTFSCVGIGLITQWHEPKVAPSDNQCESVKLNLGTIVWTRSSFCCELFAKCALIMILLLMHNGLIVLSSMDFCAKREKNEMRPLLSPHPPALTNQSESNSVTPPADLNSSAAGANGTVGSLGRRAVAVVTLG